VKGIPAFLMRRRCRCASAAMAQPFNTGENTMSNSNIKTLTTQDLCDEINALTRTQAKAKAGPSAAEQEPTIDAANTIEISWHIDDVKEVRPHLTDAQAREVLEQAKHRHDADIGINWDVLAIHADDLFPREQ
jgi:hypothetical protein